MTKRKRLLFHHLYNETAESFARGESYLSITVSRPMNCVARKMWGTHDAVRAHKARRHFWFSLTSIPKIPKRDLYGCPSRP